MSISSENGLSSGGGTGDVNATYRLENVLGGATIPHNLGKEPSVTVIDYATKQEVRVEKVFPDDNTVTLSWNGTLDVEVHLN